MKLTKVNRSALTDGAALIFTLLVSFGSLAWYHVPLALRPLQVIALVIATAIVVHVFRQEKSARAALRGKVHVHQAKIEIGVFGLLAAAIAYGNYLLSFARHGISPAYIDTGHPVYLQATGIALLTLMLCGFLNILFIRVDKKESVLEPELWSNKKLLVAGGASLLIVLLSAGRLGIIDYLLVIGAAALYTGLRRLQRHTRQHTRHAVIDLHHEVHHKRKVIH
jgi:hypothetical protein